MKKISIAIVDDYVIFRDGLKVGVTADENFEVVLEAETAKSSCRNWKRSHPM